MLVIRNYFFSNAMVQSASSPFPTTLAGGYVGPGFYSAINQILRQSSGIVPMQDANGNHIVYPYVKETFGAHGEGGYTNYTFNSPNGNPISPQVNSKLDFSTYTTTSMMPETSATGVVDSVNEIVGNGHLNDTTAAPLILPQNLSYSQDYNDVVNTYPFVPKQVDLVSGKLLEEDTYDANGNPVRKVTYKYATNFHENFWIRGLEAYLPFATPQFPYNALAFYKLHTGISHLISTIKQTFSGTNSVSEVTSYGYESPYHTLKTSDTTTDSQGNILIGKTYYSFDYANSATADNIFGKMKARYLLEPLHTQSWRNGNLVGERLTSYQDFAASAPDTLINPVHIYNLESSTPLTPTQAGESIAWAAPVSNLLPATPLVSKVNLSYDGTTGRLTTQQLPYDKYQGIQWSTQLKMPVAIVDNATNTSSVKEFYYEGFEESTTANLYTGTGRTGTHCVFAPYTVNWPLPNTRSYVITYWYLSGNVWTLSPEQPFTGTLALTGGAAYDDIRIYPKDVNMVTYTYDAVGDITSTTDAKNLTTYYEYDVFQRLKNIRDYQNNIVKSYCYNYAAQANGCYITEPTYSNNYQSRIFTKSCGSGYTGSKVTYAVNAGTYISNISQQYADNQAIADRDANGQNYANIYGNCTINATFLASNSTSDDYQVNFTAGTVNITADIPPHAYNESIAIPIGTYSVSVYPSGAYNNHTFNLTGQATVTGAPRTSYSGIVISTGNQLLLSIQ
jgi:YD repeat-containing protein